MAELKAEGRVIEVRADMIVIQPRMGGNQHPNELTIEIAVRPGEVLPGDHLQLWDDGTVEVVGKSRPLALNVREIELPSGSPQHDHS